MTELKLAVSFRLTVPLDGIMNEGKMGKFDGLLFYVEIWLQMRLRHTSFSSEKGARFRGNITLGSTKRKNNNMDWGNLTMQQKLLLVAYKRRCELISFVCGNTAQKKSS